MEDLVWLDRIKKEITRSIKRDGASEAIDTLNDHFDEIAECFTILKNQAGENNDRN